MVVAGVDGATRSGLAIVSNGRLVHWEAFRPDGNTDGKIFLGIANWLMERLGSHHVTHLALEEPLRTDLSAPVESDDEQLSSFRGPRVRRPIGTMRTFLRLYGIRAMVLVVCEELKIKHLEVNNKTWRSQIYGKGTAPPKTLPANKRSDWWKQQALDRCIAEWKWGIDSKDAAEAACIAQWLRWQLNPRWALAGDLFSKSA